MSKSSAQKRRPLRQRLQLIVLICLAVCLTGTSAIVGTYEYRLGKRNLTHDLTGIGDLMGNRSAASLIFADVDAAKSNLDAARFIPDVRALCLYNAQVQLFSQYQSKNTNTTHCANKLESIPIHGKHYFENDILWLSIAIEDQGQLLGYLLVGGELNIIKRMLFSKFSILAFAFLLSILLAYQLSQQLLRRTLQPLEDLHSLTDAISENPFHFPAEKKLQAKQNDEIGDLITSYNEMLTTINLEHRDLQSSEAKFRRLAENSPIGIYLKSADDQFTFVNKKWNQITQCYSYKAQHDYTQRIHSDDVENYRNHVQQALESGKNSIIEYRFLPPGRTQPSVLMEYLSPLADQQGYGKANGLIGSVLDISDLKNAQEELEKLAFYDPLTGLPNRRFFKDHLNFRLALAAKQQTQLCVLMIDLDNFKRVNDSMGHDAGDTLLKEISDRLRKEVFSEDVVSRIGGDEFIVLLEQTQHTHSTEQIAQRLLNACIEPITIQNHLIEVSCSIGLARFPEDADNIKDLIRHADMSLYQAKEQGKNRLAFFSKELNIELQAHIRLEQKLRKALTNNTLDVYIQPQYDHQRHRLFWGEALIRWNDPEDGFISPAEFIPVAEETGLIIEMGYWIVRQVCKLLAEHKDTLNRIGIEGVAINLSVRQFYAQDLVLQLKSIIDEFQIDPATLEIELTESMVMEDVELAIETMHQLRQLGCKLSIDDFGTGYSSLAYLKRFEIDSVKIDKSFIDGLPQDKNDAAITTAILAMSSRLGLNVIAEGIETKEQSDFLASHGCRYMQGYLFGRPMPFCELLKLPSTKEIVSSSFQI